MMKEFLVRLGLVFGAVLIAFSALELSARIFLPTPQTVEIPNVTPLSIDNAPVLNIEADRHIDTIMQYSPQGVRLRPQTRALIHNHLLSNQNVIIETNELGLRSAPIPKVKDPKEIRILIVGDSITFGDYVDLAETYPAYLEQLLKSDAHNIRVINAGLPGASLKEEYYHYLELRDAIQPDVVLVGMYLNDAQNSKNFYMRALKWPWSASRVISVLADRIGFLRARLWADDALPSEIAPEWREEFRAGRDLKSGDLFNDQAAMDYEVYNAYTDFGLAWHPQSWRILEKLLATFRSDVESKGGKFGVFLFPVHYQVKGSGIDRRPQNSFADVCSLHDLTCLDLLPALHAAWHAGNHSLLYDHCHYTKVGNEIVAQSLTPWITEHFIK